MLGFLTMAPLVVWFLINWFQTIQAVIRNYNPLPVWDYWRVVQNYDRYKALDLSVLWVQHNEHRIVFPELFFAADMLLLHGRQLLPLAISFICYFFVWIILCIALRSDKVLSPLVYGAGALLSGIMIGWQGCVVVIASPFLLQWTMLQLAATLGLLLLSQIRERRNSYLYLAGAIGCGMVATYSAGNGMVLWAILIMAAVLLSLPRPQFLILLVTALISVSMYFVGYHSSNNLNPLAIVKHPLYFACFIASYLSIPFGALGTSPLLGVVFGCISLIVFSTSLVISARTPLLITTTGIVLLGSYLFTLSSAILTSIGRMNPADPTFAAAKAARYVSLPLVNWAVLALAMVWLSSRRQWKVLSPGNLILIASLLLLTLFLKLTPWIRGNSTISADQQWATLSVESGLFSPNIVRKLFPDPDFVKAQLETLRQNHLSIYAGQGDVARIGHSAELEFSGTRGNKQTGGISRMAPIREGVEIVGYGPPLPLAHI